MLSQKDHVHWFRNSAPYINAHRDRVFVLCLSGEATQHKNFANIIHDIALLNSLGVKLVLVHGARPQIDAQLSQSNHSSKFHKGLRITEASMLGEICQAVGGVRHKIEALLSMGLINSPMHGAKIRVCSGNFVIAKPMGIIDGIDFSHTGEVRRIDCQGIRQQTDSGSIALLSPIGYSTTGEMFNLAMEEVAISAAKALTADKLIFFSADQGLLDHNKALIRTYQPNQNDKLSLKDPAQQQLLTAAITACQNDVKRCHIISYQEDGALLHELFSRQGSGTLVSQNFEALRTATINDVGGILEILEPLENSNVLVKRSRELLEREIHHFVVIERDGMITACAALYTFEENNMAEIACVAAHDDYKGNNLGKQLLQALIQRAQQKGIEKLFVLTTRTAHWFIEQGFAEVAIEKLPNAKQKLYNLQRNSKAFQLLLNN